MTDLAGVVTYHNDNLRTGQNRQEYALTPALVSGATFGKRFSCAVDGQLYAQPLYVANLTIGGGTHNVIFVATEHDSVYAFDADASPCVQYWQKSFLVGGAITIEATESDDLVPEIGITSTPVIDLASGTLYVLVRTREGDDFVQRLHALDVATPAEKFGGPVVIQATLPGTGTGTDGVNITFNPLIQNQRSALLLANGVVYIAWASHGDWSDYHGWVIGYNAATLARVSTYNDSANADEAGIWMSGNGPVADAGGSIYVITGNGEFDANGSIPPAAPFNDFGDSFIRLSRGPGGRRLLHAGQSARTRQWATGTWARAARSRCPTGWGPWPIPICWSAAARTAPSMCSIARTWASTPRAAPTRSCRRSPCRAAALPAACTAHPLIWQTGASTAIMYLGAVDDTLRAYALARRAVPGEPDHGQRRQLRLPRRHAVALIERRDGWHRVGAGYQPQRHVESRPVDRAGGAPRL